MLALLATLLFSIATPVARWVLVAGGVPTSIVLARMVLSTLGSASVILAVKPTLIAPGRRGMGLSFLAGAINGVGMLLYFMALTRLDASITAMLLAIGPLMVLSLLALRGEKLTRRHGVRVILALVGVYLLIGPGGDIDPIGVVLVLASTVMFSLHLAMIQWYLRPYEAMTVTLYANAGMLVMIFIWWIIQGRPWVIPGLGGWAAIIVLAVLCTIVARLAMVAAVNRIGSGQMSLLSSMEILLAVIWSTIFLGERLSLTAWVGGGLILVSAVLAVQRLRLASMRPRWRVIPRA
jgi:drug/metabolite transporter (DMT)-like permease